MRVFLTLIVLALLTACASRRPLPADPLLLTAQAEREALLAARSGFQVSGRIAIADGRDSGSGSFQWRQEGPNFEFSFSAPVSRRSWRLSEQRGRVTLEGLDQGPVVGVDAELLLRQELGLEVPVALMRRWILGLRADPRAEIGFDAQGRPAAIAEVGWQVNFRDWFSDLQPPLPRRVFAERGEARVRVVIDQWVLDER